MHRRTELAVSITAATVGVAAVIVCAVLIIRYYGPAPARRCAQEPALAEQGMAEGSRGTRSRALALIHSEHCKHCKKLVPIFQQFRRAGLPIALVDGGAKPVSWFVKNRVTRYPTVCVLELDQDEQTVLQQYPPNGQRTASAIFQFGVSTGVFKQPQ